MVVLETAWWGWVGLSVVGLGVLVWLGWRRWVQHKSLGRGGRIALWTGVGLWAGLGVAWVVLVYLYLASGVEV